MRRFVALALTLATLVAGCAVNPVSGRPELVLMSAAEEKQIGAEEAGKVEQGIGLVESATVTPYVQAVGQRVAEQSPRHDVEYRFAVVDVSEPNAFALPGGYVYVTRGLLALVNSEDELAAVLGHEIGHVAARHAVQQATRTAPFAVITNLSAAITSIASPFLGQVVGGVGQLASGLVLTPFSRDQEREADRLGQEMAARAGWDPAALSGFLDTLEREAQLHGAAPRHFGFLATHPSTPERVANTAAYAAELPRVARAPLSATRADFLYHLDGLVVGTPAAAGVFEGQLFLHPTLDFVVRFPDGWSTQNLRHEVAAAAPDESALLVVEAVADSNDPLDGARAAEQASGKPLLEHTKPLMVSGLKAARTSGAARTAQGDLSIELAWLAHAGHVYQLTGMTPIERREAFVPVFDRVLESFRPLRPAERKHIRETRLRIVAARANETLRALATRSKTTWNPDTLAAANAVPASATLAKGQLLKVPVSEIYGHPKPH